MFYFSFGQKSTDEFDADQIPCFYLAHLSIKEQEKEALKQNKNSAMSTLWSFAACHDDECN